MKLVEDDVINYNTAKDVLAEMFLTGKSAENIVSSKELSQITDESQITELIRQILDENPDQVASYLQGKEQLRGWFMGQVMRATEGKANPKIVNSLLSQELSQLKT